jgi:hypothetical protein
VTSVPVAAPQARTVAGDSDATLIESKVESMIESIPTVPMPAIVVTAVQPAASTSASPSKRNGRVGLAAAVIVAVAAAAGWYALHKRQSPPPPLAVTNPAPNPAPAPVVVRPQAPDAGNPASKTVAGNKPTVATPSPSLSVAAKKPGVTAPPKVGASLSARTIPATPKIEPLGFDPMSLDPKQNARLKIDAGGMPRGVDFIVEMNGRVYSRNSGGIGQDSFVPPGVQEFRVSAKSGKLQQTSNTVSTDFLPKKKHTLKVELRLKGQPASAGMPQGLYPASQIVITLK